MNEEATAFSFLNVATGLNSALSLREKYARIDTYFTEKQAVREAATICARPCELTFDLLTLKVVSESRVTWATSVPILVFL